MGKQGWQRQFQKGRLWPRQDFSQGVDQGARTIGPKVVPIKALVMDIDGVIIHDQPHWHVNMEKDLGISSALLERKFFKTLWPDIIIGKAELHECLSDVLTEIAPHLSAERLMEYWFEKDSRLNKPLLAYLEKVRASGIRIHGATNQEHARAKYLWNNLCLRNHMDGFHYSAALSCRKPDLKFFHLIAKNSGFAAAELVLVDDTYENIQGAKSAGWQTFHWNKEGENLSRLSEMVEKN